MDYSSSVLAETRQQQTAVAICERACEATRTNSAPFSPCKSTKLCCGQNIAHVAKADRKMTTTRHINEILERGRRFEVHEENTFKPHTENDKCEAACLLFDETTNERTRPNHVPTPSRHAHRLAKRTSIQPLYTLCRPCGAGVVDPPLLLGSTPPRPARKLV